MGPRYDLFSLGCTIWRVLCDTMPPSIARRTQMPPFWFFNPANGAISVESHEKMAANVEKMPEGPEKILLQLACRCLHPNRMERPENAAEVQRILDAFLQNPSQ